MELRRACALLLVVVCGLLLAWSLTLPTVTFQAVGSELEVYSIPGGIRTLWDDGDVVLAPIVFAFSVLIPFGKLVLLAWILLERGAPGRHARLARFLQRHGKWSLLDVFLVAAFVGAIRLGLVAHAAARVGILVFGASVLLSMLAAHLVVDLQPAAPRAEPAPGALGGPWSRAVSTTSLLALGTCFFVPLLDVRKALLFRNEVALTTTTGRLFAHGELTLAAAMVVFVLLIPGLRALLLAWLRWSARPPARAARAAAALGEWGMLDVFGLGLVLALVKLEELSTTRALPGFWVLLLAGVLAGLDGWLLGRGRRA